MINNQVYLRKAEISDAEFIASLSSELGYLNDSQEMKKRLEAILNKADHSIFVANKFNCIIGWIHVGISESVESGTFAELYGLIITEKERGKGIGTLLVNEAEKWAKNKGYERIRVRTNVIREHTHKFYEKLGYEIKKTQTVFDKKLNNK